MSEYHKINTMFKRNLGGGKKVILGAWVDPVIEYLKDNAWTFTEKVDGTNIRVYWDGNELVFGGKTDNAQIPSGVMNRLNELFSITPAGARLSEVFPDGGVTFYGEGYGAKIQSGDKYKATQDFVLYDVKVGDLWLERHNVEDVALKLGLDVVPVIGHGTLQDAINVITNNLRSRWGDFEAEGIVARPTIELLTRRGERIITKIKAIDLR